MREKIEMTPHVSAFLRKCLLYRTITPFNEPTLYETRTLGIQLLLEAQQLMEHCISPLHDLDKSKLHQSLFMITSVFDYLTDEFNSQPVLGEKELMGTVARTLARVLRSRARPATPAEIVSPPYPAPTPAIGSSSELLVEEIDQPQPPTASRSPRPLVASQAPLTPTPAHESAVLVARQPGHCRTTAILPNPHLFGHSASSRSASVRDTADPVVRFRL